jgi:hypothetical protein
VTNDLVGHVLNEQNYDEHTRRFFYVLIGRLLWGMGDGGDIWDLVAIHTGRVVALPKVREGPCNK